MRALAVQHGPWPARPYSLLLCARTGCAEHTLAVTTGASSDDSRPYVRIVGRGTPTLEFPANPLGAGPGDIRIGSASKVASDFPAMPSEAPHTAWGRRDRECLPVGTPGDPTGDATGDSSRADVAEVDAFVPAVRIWVDYRTAEPGRRLRSTRCAQEGRDARSAHHNGSFSTGDRPRDSSVHDKCSLRRLRQA